MVGFCLSVLAVSCSQSEQEHTEVSQSKNSDEKILKLINKPQIDKSKLVTKKGLQENIERPEFLTNRTISFNGEKYLFEGKKLQKGSKVRNIHMSEYGTVKGTFVIVAKTGTSLDLSLMSKSKIAKDTFRITPAKTDDLMTIYNELILNESIDIVELEVGYSDKKPSMAEY